VRQEFGPHEPLPVAVVPKALTEFLATMAGASDGGPPSLADCQSTNLAVASGATACAVTPMNIGAGDRNRTGDVQLGKLAQ
jgi:hypothetical protein